MKIKLSWIFLATSLLLMLTGCSRRDLSTPSSRLVGHWQSPDGDYEHYYGPIDKDTRIGNYAEVDKDGKAVYYKYKVTSENHNGEELEIALSFDESFPVSLPYWVSKDGLELSAIEQGEYTDLYVDSKTEP